VAGPALLTFSVNVTGWPTVTWGLSTVIASDKSATCGVIVTLSSSSSAGLLLFGVESGSRWSAAVTSAVLVMAVVPVTMAVTCMMAVVPAGTVPTVHRPVAGS